MSKDFVGIITLCQKDLQNIFSYYVLRGEFIILVTQYLTRMVTTILNYNTYYKIIV